ncbi:biliverdin-producing heme oxygenase [Gordonia jinhuaensis]|uniref:Biliverdin-producing heme oxygenase n=1 Tax=Gordonia jinhuaensis TaxID=1517702 RepID=A0A916TDK6_9ACTN|nr:biliverdin-producing heme oxygenase [Gordonia jinhuaensis]GGB40946.1 biliverdin-producing heme oxygenase [Gordonia jinhuaensis]
MSFVTRLRSETQQAHTDAEQSEFIGALLRGELDADALTDLLAQYHPVYRALEEVGDGLADDPMVVPFLSEDLRRLPSLEADLAARRGDRWREALTPLPASTALAERIAATRHDPVAFLAHHYTRYLGDLSGGQIIATLVGRHYDIDPEHLAFYRFDSIGKPKVYRDHYHQLLESAAWTEPQRTHFIDECIVAYRLNRELFDALAVRPTSSR